MKLSLKSLLLVAALAASNCGAMNQQQGPAIQVLPYIMDDLAADRGPNQQGIQLPIQGSGMADFEDPQETLGRMIRKHRMNRLQKGSKETLFAVGCSLLGSVAAKMAETKYENSGTHGFVLPAIVCAGLIGSSIFSYAVLEKSLKRMIDSRRPLLDRAMESVFSAATLGTAGLLSYRFYKM